MNILIVDDSGLVSSKIKELIEDANISAEITICGTCADAVYLFDTHTPDVVLLDINLPDRSGIYLLQHIKKLFSKTAVIMITNQSSDYYKRLCYKMGAYEFLDKSNDFDRLPSILTSL